MDINNIQHWVGHALETNDFVMDELAKTPYSHIFRIQTNTQAFFLKKSPPDFYKEALILEKLQSLKTPTPQILAKNDDLGCFLMPSCGRHTLRHYFHGQLKSDLIIQGFKTYINVQKTAESHSNDFIALGVCDWRLNKLPALYHELAKDIQKLEFWNLTYQDIESLQNAHNFFQSLCDELAKANIPDTLNQSDIHDNNMIYDETSNIITIIDYGECNIGNPLISLATSLHAIRIWYNKWHGLSLNAPIHKKLNDFVFDDYRDTEKQVKAIAMVYYVLTIRDLMNRSGETFPSWRQKTKNALMAFLNFQKEMK